MKKIALMALAAITLAACGSNDEAKPLPAAQSATEGAVRIAYIDVDSLQNKYVYFQEAKVQFDQKMQQHHTILQQKEQALQSMQNSIQQRMQNGQINSQQQYEAEMRKYQQQQQAYAQYAQQAEAEMAQEQNACNQSLMDSINNFLADYNKTKKYNVILNKATTIYIDKAYDITNEVVAGLNKRYKK